MKLKQIIITSMFLFWVFQPASAQTGSEKGTSISLQLGASTPFGLPANSSAIIPQIGIDFNFGQFGLRANGQFFKTDTEFDMNAYLDPISSFITQTGEDKNSNLIIGISPYLNLPLKGFTLQPNLGINYLMQNGADLMVNYNNLAPGAILNATGGDLKRSAVILAPSIRALLGDENKPLRFFAEAGYSMAVGIKEYKITSRNLDGVIRPDGSIDADLMEMGATITHTEKIFPSSFIIGVGIELNIMSSGSGNHNTSRSNMTPPVANFEENTDDKKGDECCEQLIVKSVTNPEDSCCAMISYYTNKGCYFNKVVVNALGGKTFNVQWDISGGNQWNDVGTYQIISTATTGFPYNATTDLIKICSSPISQGSVDLEMIFYRTTGQRCIKYVTIECPTTQEPNECCDKIDIHQQANEDPCCAEIRYTKTNNCDYNKAEIRSLNGKTFTISQDAFGNSNFLGTNYSVYSLGSNLPYYAAWTTQFLATICSSPITQGDVIVEVSMYEINGTICKDTLTIICPTQSPCQCIIKSMKVGTSIIQDGDILQFTNNFIPANGTQLDMDGECNPPKKCNPTYFWQIMKPDNSTVTLSGKTINYYFLNSGTYKCIANMNCEDLTADQATIHRTCTKSFTIKVSRKPSGIELPMIPSSGNTMQVFKPGEPVPGAELFLEQTEADEEPIMASETGANGSVIVIGIQPGDYSLKLKFPLKKGKKKSSKPSLTEQPSGVISSNTTDISSLKRVKSYIINCPDGVYNLVIYGLDGIEPEKDLIIIPKYNVTVSKGTDEYEIEIIKFSMGCCKGSVTSTVAFSFYALPEVPFIPKEGQTLPPNIINAKDIKQRSAFTAVNHYGIHEERIK